MKRNDKVFKQPLLEQNNLSNEVSTEAGAGAATGHDSILQDEPSTGGFGEMANSGQEAKAEQQPLPMAKPAQNLELTLKTIKVLHQATIQRDNLLSRIADLEEFEVELREEGDELERNIYAGCKLIIADGNGKQFVTNTSKLIAKVAQFVKDTCHDRLTEIEAEIVFPY